MFLLSPLREFWKLSSDCSEIFLPSRLASDIDFFFFFSRNIELDAVSCAVFSFPLSNSLRAVTSFGWHRRDSEKLVTSSRTLPSPIRQRFSAPTAAQISPPLSPYRQFQGIDLFLARNGDLFFSFFLTWVAGVVSPAIRCDNKGDLSHSPTGTRIRMALFPYSSAFPFFPFFSPIRNKTYYETTFQSSFTPLIPSFPLR